MLLQNREILSGLYNVYYKGKHIIDDFILNVVRRLGPLSIMRMKNEKDNLHIDFQKVGFGNLIISEDQFDISQLFDRLKQSKEMFEECQSVSTDMESEELYDLTNGHDICLYLGVILKNAGKKLGEDGVRNILLSNFRKSDFASTNLYHSIKQYQIKYNLQYVE